MLLVKREVYPRTDHTGPGRDRCVTKRSCQFTPRKDTRYPFYWKLGGPQGRSGQVRKITPPLGFDPRTAQLVTTTLSQPTVFFYANEK
jgi:hypothetical protein